MTFQSYVYPHRNNQPEFTKRLIEKVDTEFTEIVSLPGNPRRTLGGNRCRLSLNQGPLLQTLLGMGEVGYVCNYDALLSDKVVAKSLLRAWRRDIPDRYLDFAAVSQFQRRRFSSHADAYATIRQNAPRGAVKFLYNELSRSTGNLSLAGNSISRDMTYNRFYSTLIAWDKLHCFGLVMELQRLNNQLSLGGGSTVPAALQAACLWIHTNQSVNNRSIYHIVASG